jgi:hypothetical protein
MWEQVQEALNSSVARVLTGLASLLPGIVALALAVLIASLIAWVVELLVRRLLRGLRVDERLERVGLTAVGQWTPGGSPAQLVGRAVFWLIVIVGFLIGFAALDATLTSQLAMRLFAYLPNVVVAVLLFAAGSILARFLARSVLIGAVNQNIQYARFVSLGVKWLVLVLAAAMALQHLQIGGRIVDIAFGILFGGIVLTLALAIGLGSKDLVSRSLERQAAKGPEEPAEPVSHL